jgi:hypothetical protein
VAKHRLNAFGQSRGERFIRLQFFMLKSDAWRSLTPDAKAILLHVWERHNGINNDEISYAVREAEAPWDLQERRCPRIRPTDRPWFPEGDPQLRLQREAAPGAPVGHHR